MKNDRSADDLFLEEVESEEAAGKAVVVAAKVTPRGPGDQGNGSFFPCCVLVAAMLAFPAHAVAQGFIDGFTPGMALDTANSHPGMARMVLRSTDVDPWRGEMVAVSCEWRDGFPVCPPVQEGLPGQITPQHPPDPRRWGDVIAMFGRITLGCNDSMGSWVWSKPGSPGDCCRSPPSIPPDGCVPTSVATWGHQGAGRFNSMARAAVLCTRGGRYRVPSSKGPVDICRFVVPGQVPVSGPDGSRSEFRLKQWVLHAGILMRDPWPIAGPADLPGPSPGDPPVTPEPPNPDPPDPLVVSCPAQIVLGEELQCSYPATGCDPGGWIAEYRSIRGTPPTPGASIPCSPSPFTGSCVDHTAKWADNRRLGRTGEWEILTTCLMPDGRRRAGAAGVAVIGPPVEPPPVDPTPPGTPPVEPPVECPECVECVKCEECEACAECVECPTAPPPSPGIPTVAQLRAIAAACIAGIDRGEIQEPPAVVDGGFFWRKGHSSYVAALCRRMHNGPPVTPIPPNPPPPDPSPVPPGGGGETPDPPLPPTFPSACHDMAAVAVRLAYQGIPVSRASVKSCLGRIKGPGQGSSNWPQMLHIALHLSGESDGGDLLPWLRGENGWGLHRPELGSWLYMDPVVGSVMLLHDRTPNGSVREAAADWLRAWWAVQAVAAVRVPGGVEAHVGDAHQVRPWRDRDFGLSSGWVACLPAERACRDPKDGNLCTHTDSRAGNAVLNIALGLPHVSATRWSEPGVEDMTLADVLPWAVGAIQKGRRDAYPAAMFGLTDGERSALRSVVMRPDDVALVGVATKWIAQFDGNLWIHRLSGGGVAAGMGDYGYNSNKPCAAGVVCDGGAMRIVVPCRWRGVGAGKGRCTPVDGGLSCRCSRGGAVEFFPVDAPAVMRVEWGDGVEVSW